MDERRQELLQRSAAPAYRRIDRDLGAASEPLRPILRLIRANLFRPGFNVDRIRATLRLPSNVTTRFRRELGAPLHRYLEKRRLETSCKLLVDSRLDFPEIARLVGYKKRRTWSDAFARRLGCRPQAYRASGGLLSRQAARAPAPDEAAARDPGPGMPRFVAGIATLTIEDRCARCGTGLDAGPAARVFEDGEAICGLCALEHAPRELADFLFVDAVRRRPPSAARLERVTEPETILAGRRRPLSQATAGLLRRALPPRAPLSAGVAGEVLGRREDERERLLDRER